jgi:hypothetical protein
VTLDELVRDPACVGSLDQRSSRARSPSVENEREPRATAATQLPGSTSARHHSSASGRWRVEGFEARSPLDVSTTGRHLQALPEAFQLVRTKRGLDVHHHSRPTFRDVASAPVRHRLAGRSER